MLKPSSADRNIKKSNANLVLKFVLTCGLALTLALSAQVGFASSGTWNGIGPAWNADANWNPDVAFPNTVADIATFTELGAAQPTSTIPVVAINVREINFDAVTVTNYTVTIEGGGSLIFTTTGITNTSGIAQNISNSGTLTFNTTANIGNNVTITNNVGATLNFNGTGTAVNAVVINSGTLELGGAGAIVNIGSLAGSGAVNLGGGGLTVGALNTSTTVSGIIAGNDGLIKVGTGTLTLTGTNTYFGTTTVNAGTLVINGDNSGAGGAINLNSANLTVGLSAAEAAASTGGGAVSTGDNVNIRGFGTIGGLLNNLVSSGTVSPGADNSIGTLSVTGAYNQNATPGTLNIEINSAGQTDLLAVTGAATITGGQLNIDTTGGFIAGQTYTILTSGGLLTGQFAAPTFNGAAPTFITATLAYPGNSVTLAIEPNGAAITAAAATANERSVADYLLALPANQVPAVWNTFISSNPSNAALSLALAQISDATTANQSAVAANIAKASGFDDELADRFSLFPGCRNVGGSCKKASLPSSHGIAVRKTKHGPHHTITVSKTIHGVKIVDCNQIRSTWVVVEGESDKLKAGAVSGIDNSSGGIALGYEIPIKHSGAIGSAFRAGHFNSKATGQEISNAHGNLFQLGVYGRYQVHRLLLGASVEGGVTDGINATRTITFANANISSNYNVYLVSEQLRAAVDLFHSIVRPYVGVFNQNSKRPGFTENGNSGLELKLNKSMYHSFRSQLGIMLNVPVGQTVNLFAAAAWEHEFANDFVDMSAQLAQVGGSAFFTVRSTAIGRNTAGVKAGMQITSHRNYDVSFLYVGQFASKWHENGGRIEANYRFM